MRQSVVLVCMTLVVVIGGGMLVLWWGSPIQVQMQFIQTYWLGFLVIGVLFGIAAREWWR